MCHAPMLARRLGARVTVAAARLGTARTQRTVLRCRCTAGSGPSATKGVRRGDEKNSRPKAVHVAVVDAFDFEVTFPAVARRLKGEPAVILAIARSEKLPYLGQGELEYLRRRFERHGTRCISAIGLSDLDGQSLSALSSEVVVQAGRLGTGLVVVAGVPGESQSSILGALTEEMNRLRGSATHRPGEMIPSVIDGMEVGSPYQWDRHMWSEREADGPKVEVSEWVELSSVNDVLIELRGSPPVVDGVGGWDDGSNPSLLLGRLEISRDQPTPIPLLARLFAPTSVQLRVVDHGESSSTPAVDDALVAGKLVPSEHFTFMQGHAVELVLPGVGWMTLCGEQPFKVQSHSPPAARAVSRRPMYSRGFSPSTTVVYAAHLPPEEIASGIAASELITGKLTVTFRNPTNGFVPLDASAGNNSMTVSLAGRDAMNRALHGDEVAVRVKGDVQAVLRRALETERVERSRDDAPYVIEAADKGTSIPDGYSTGGTKGPRAGAHVASVAHGEVVGILKRAERQLVVLFDTEKHAKSMPMIVTPRDARFPRLVLSRTAEAADDLMGKLMVARVTGWGAQERAPSAEHVRTLGEAGSLTAETEAYLLEHAVAIEPFSKDVLACLPSAQYVIPPEEIARRLDLRNGDAHVYSIDPPGCVDIDDALHLKNLGDGRFEVGVHIADVCHFVERNTPLDLESARRAETFYLVNTRANMVPELLSENLCSLHPHVDRLAFSVIMEMDDAANVISRNFVKTVIRSRGALSYAEAQARIDAADGTSDELTTNLKTLNRLARKLRQRRMDEGALELASSEVKFELEMGSDGRPDPRSLPTAMTLSTSDAAHSLIEEFMVLANCLVARRTAEAFPRQALLRLHPQPKLDDFASLQRALARHGIPFNAATAADLANSLKCASKPGDQSFNHVVRLLATRCIAPARYFRSGAIPKEEWSHCGLAEPVYTHFTSPIRRYADQVS